MVYLFVKNSDIYPIHERLITRSEKETLLGHKGMVFWLYGLSGSGKSTLVLEMERQLHQIGIHTLVLDGDNLRSGINQDLGFSEKDREENIRRVSEMAKILSQGGIIVLVSLITPLCKFRTHAKSIIGGDTYREIYVHASFETCRGRDVKGLYARAEQGKVQSFTGQESAFEEPGQADLILDTESDSLDESSQKLLNYIKENISNT
jgi:adenylylsulfate kinase